MATPKAPPIDEFVAASGNTSKGCWFNRIAADLTDEQKAKLDRALKEPAVSAGGISTVLDRWGYPVSPAQAAHHRRGGCACGK